VPSLITLPITTSGVRDIYITEEERFAYVVTSGGVDVIELVNTCKVVASGKLPNEPTCIAADWRAASGQLYIGTVASGVFAMSYHRSRKGDFTDQLVQRFTTTTAPPLSNNQINDVDALPGRLIIGTGAGVDFISNDTEYSTRALVSGSLNVHLTGGGAGYWTTVSGNKGEVEVNYDLISTTGTSIINVDFEYSPTSDPALPGAPPTDIAISERPSFAPVLAFATPSGALITEEIQFNEAAAQRKTLTSENAFSVDFSEEASFGFGKLYALLDSVLRVYDLSNDTVVASHAQSSVGSARGQILSSGTNTIVRTTILA